MTEPLGHLVAICTAAAAGAPMRALAEVEAIAGCGLAGDRYAEGIGKFSGRFEVAAGAREISLIDAAAVDACNTRMGSHLHARDLRRNLVISGLDLDALHGSVLSIGHARLLVLGACPPCGYLSRLLGMDAVRGLRHLGGARASIQQSGVLVVGAEVNIHGAARRTG